MRIFILLISCVLLSACSIFKTVRVVKVEKIDRIYLDFNPSQNINFGQPIIGGVIAQMHNGKEIDLTNHKNLQFNSLHLEQLNDGFRAIGYPTSFNEKYFHVNAIFKTATSEEYRELTDSIPINYRGDISIVAEGQRGQNGIDGADGKQNIFSRHGEHGNHGQDGGFGQDGANLIINLWKEGDTLRAAVQNSFSDQIWFYQGIGAEKIDIDVSGGRGGNAGDGGNGAQGRKGKSGTSWINQPGDGGNGGNGGRGGQGGNGGQVTIYIHSSASTFQNKIFVENGGGRGGLNGNPGKAGLGGQPLTNQTAGRNGFPGYRGVDGNSGMSGGSPEIFIQDFDITQYEPK